MTEEKTFCRGCGHPVESGANFCRICGQPASPGEERGVHKDIQEELQQELQRYEKQRRILLEKERELSAELERERKRLHEVQEAESSGKGWICRCGSVNALEDKECGFCGWTFQWKE